MGDRMPESDGMLDGADVLGFARQRHDAIGFGLKMQAEAVRRAILGLDQASFQAMKHRLGPDIDDALSCCHDHACHENAAPQQI
jgi:hypothetical protein